MKVWEQTWRDHSEGWLWGEAEQEANTGTGFVHPCSGIWVQFLGWLGESSTKIGLSAYFKYFENA